MYGSFRGVKRGFSALLAPLAGMRIDCTPSVRFCLTGPLIAGREGLPVLSQAGRIALRRSVGVSGSQPGMQLPAAAVQVCLKSNCLEGGCGHDVCIFVVVGVVALSP